MGRSTGRSLSLCRFRVITAACAAVTARCCTIASRPTRLLSTSSLPGQSGSEQFNCVAMSRIALSGPVSPRCRLLRRNSTPLRLLSRPLTRLTSCAMCSTSKRFPPSKGATLSSHCGDAGRRRPSKSLCKEDCSTAPSACTSDCLTGTGRWSWRCSTACTSTLSLPSDSATWSSSSARRPTSASCNMVKVSPLTGPIFCSAYRMRRSGNAPDPVPSLGASNSFGFSKGLFVRARTVFICACVALTRTPPGQPL
mmetsp:Transcript_12103/g.27942  ORF Transcript_12103/g.27942 Transcript_12103/m.27942 type:complete len:253 (-) Transcript_12103:66-824(-)